MDRDNKPNSGTFIPPPEAIEITDDKFKEMAEKTFSTVEEMGIGEDGMAPMVIVHHRTISKSGVGDIETTCVAINANFNDSDEKREVMENIGRGFFARQQVPVAIFMASEAWLSNSEKEVPRVMPRDDPNRKEVLVIAGRTLEGECKCLSMIVVGRDEEGKMTRTGETQKQFILSDDNTLNRIDTFLLDCFLHGFFEKVAASFLKEKESKSRN